MSYLDVPRINFSGRFYTDPSTVNNLAVNYQPPKPGERPPADWDNRGNWNWNPNGRHYFELRDCAVMSVQMPDGKTVVNPSEDPIIGAAVTHVGKTTPKMGGWDVVQQYLPSIWGLELGIDNAFRGHMQHVAAIDQWFRNQNPSVAEDDYNTTARFQSVLTDVRWDESDSAACVALRERAREACGDESPKLSINMVIDGFYGKTACADPRYLTGRVVGSISYAVPGEPDHFVAKRLLRPDPFMTALWNGTPLFFAPFQVDHERRKLVIDFGNSLPRSSFGESAIDVGELAVVDEEHTTIGAVGYMAEVFDQAASIQEYGLSDKLYERIRERPVKVIQSGKDGDPRVVLGEDPKGRHVRADQFVYRCNVGEAAEVELYARVFGEPARNQTLWTANDPRKISQYDLFTQSTRDPKQDITIPIGQPTDGVLELPDSVTTDEAGRATLLVRAIKSPGGPRLDGAVDGQIYGVSYTWPDLLNISPHDYVNVRVFDSVELPDRPTWVDHVSPIFQLYAQLYPAMTKIIDLGDYEAVKENAEAIKATLTLPVEDAGYMPVHRELSRDKLVLILRWLELGLPYNGSEPC